MREQNIPVHRMTKTFLTREHYGLTMVVMNGMGYWSLCDKYGVREMAKRLRVTSRYVHQMRSLGREVSTKVMVKLRDSFPEWDANVHFQERAEVRTQSARPDEAA